MNIGFLCESRVHAVLRIELFQYSAVNIQMFGIDLSAW